MHLGQRSINSKVLLGGSSGLLIVLTAMTFLSLRNKGLPISNGEPEAVSIIDGPRASKLDVPTMGWVNMMIEDTVHYNPHSPESEEEFSRLLPSGRHLIHVNGQDHPYTLAMFHQLDCLGVIAKQYAEHTLPTDLTRHCLNYLRQSVLCLADNRLESVRKPEGDRIVSFSSDYVCRDWTTVYDVAEANYRRYSSQPHANRDGTALL